MKTNRLAPLLLAILAGCASPPRVSTESERAAVTALLNAAATGIAVAAATGKIPPADAQMATAQLQALRDRVTASAETPISWPDLFTDITAFSAAWAIAKS